MSTLAEQVIDHGVDRQAQQQHVYDAALVAAAIAELHRRPAVHWKRWLHVRRLTVGTAHLWFAADPAGALARRGITGLLVDTDALYARHHLTLIEVGERYANDAESRAVYDAVVTAPAEGGM